MSGQDKLRSGTAVIGEISDKLFGMPGLFNVGATPSMKYDPHSGKITARTVIWRRPGIEYPGRPGQEKTDELAAFLQKELPRPADPEGFARISRVDVLGETGSVRILAPGEKVPADLEHMHASAIAIDSNDAYALQQRLDGLAHGLAPQQVPDRARDAKGPGGPPRLG